LRASIGLVIGYYHDGKLVVLLLRVAGRDG
jgi:hypothetical protein